MATPTEPIQTNQIVRLTTGQIGFILECDYENDQHTIRILTPLFADYQYLNFKSSQFCSILQINNKSLIHECGLLSLIDLHPFDVVFEEPILIPFAPRIQSIHNNNDNNNNSSNESIITKVLKWWNDIHQHTNKNKLNTFMNLSHHTEGPIVENVDAFLSRHYSELIHAFKDNKCELEQLRTALLIDGANTFDQGAYELICRINHSCDPNCFVTTDSKLKALRNIHRNEELLWNFMNDKYLYSCTEIRVQKLYEIWGFTCNCSRCKASFDDMRVFKCVKCSQSSIRVSYDMKLEKEDLEEKHDSETLYISTHVHDCFLCQYILQAHEIEYYLSMEQKIDSIITAIEMDHEMEETEIEFDETIAFIALYLSDRHFKWFDLWNAMIVHMSATNNNDKICGKTLKYVLIKCYQSMMDLYSKSMNYYLYEIEWRLLNCMLNDCDTSKEKELVQTLYASIDKAKDTFSEMDIEQWKQVKQHINIL